MPAHPNLQPFMPIPTILGQGVFLMGTLLVAFARLGSQRRSAIQAKSPVRDAVAPEPRGKVPLKRLPDSSSLAGVPLRVLLTDRSGPGALLRDTLMIRPSTRDP